ncbi:MAG: PAS domain-containing protein [Dongiaceae bacterium]
MGELSECGIPTIGSIATSISTCAIHQKLRPVLRHWLALYEIGQMPRRSDLDACAFASCLSDVMLLKVIGHGADFRYDLYGENLRNIFAVTYHGRTLRDVAFDGFEKLIAEYAHVAVTAEPLYVERQQISERNFMTVTVAKLILPLSEDGCSVSDLFVCLTRIA